MRKHYSGNILLTSLLIMSGLLIVIFIHRDNWLATERLTQHYYQHYLNGRISLIENIKADETAYCNQAGYGTDKERKEGREIIISHHNIHYSFYCQFDSIFLQEKPETTKYIRIDNIQNWLNLQKYQPPITYIQDLNELPPSSEDNPQIVIAQNAISGRLVKNFYGIIITDYLFSITGQQFQGTLYSTYDNSEPTRYIRYNRNVINNIEKAYSQWYFLPHSRNILNESSD